MLPHLTEKEVGEKREIKDHFFIIIIIIILVIKKVSVTHPLCGVK